MTRLLWPALALLIGGALCRLLVALAARLPHDAPNARSLHAAPVPRVGGLTIWGAFVPLALWSTALPGGWRTWAGGALLLAVSCVDDWRGASARVRLTVHLAAAVLAASAIVTAADWATLALLAIAIAWGANAYNFMDGSDGLAAAMALCGFGAYALASGPAAHGLCYTILVASVIPFAAMNAPPARMFLGDFGAVPLGFLAVVFGVAGVAGAVARVVSCCSCSCRSRRCDRHARSAGCGDASGLGRRIAATTTSGCISLGAGHRRHAVDVCGG